MIEIACPCGATLSAGEDQIHEPSTCAGCGSATTYACGEALPADAGAGDFDVALVVLEGPAKPGTQVALGGVADVAVGKADGKLVQLLGHRVSRNHATLSRVDFGPGRWAIRDLGSTNGTFVNGTRLERDEPHTLEFGDRLSIGEFEFEVRHSAPAAVAIGGGKASAGGGVAAALAESFDGFEIADDEPIKPPPIARAAIPAPAAKARAPVAVGGRRGAPSGDDVDENQIRVNAETLITPLSFLWRLGMLPVGFGKVRGVAPRAAWAVVGLVALCGALFAFSTQNLFRMQGVSPAVANLMLWSGVDAPKTPKDEAKAPPAAAQKRLAKLAPKPAAADAENGDEEMSDEEAAEMRAEFEQTAEKIEAWNAQVGFRPYQLVTHAFVPGLPGWIGFGFFLVPQLIFLTLFGLPTNKLLGHWRFIASYLALVVLTGLAYHLAIGGGPKWPTGGPGGAIMGLAGMYLVLCPRETVYTAVWARLGLLSGFRLRLWIWKLPSFLMFVLWVALADVLPTVLSSKLSGKVVGPMLICHLVGLFAGVVIASAWLLTKQTDAHGRDLISILSGPRAVT